MAFPFRVGKDGPDTCGRNDHVRHQIEQVIFTNLRERVFRPEFGAGVRRLIFEPNTLALRDAVKKRLIISLTDALFGEVDPKTLEVDAQIVEEKLIVTVRYVLAAIGTSEEHRFSIGPGAGQNG
jgi:hypothetical protein